MGGSSSSSRPINTSQSNAALAGASGAASNLGALGGQYNQEQQQLFNLLWGTPGTKGVASGPLPAPPAPQIPSGPTNLSQVAGSPDAPSILKNSGFDKFMGIKPTATPQSPNPVAPIGGPRPVAPAMSGGGGGGAASGPAGVLTGFLNPSNLNVTSPTGPFAGAFTNDKTQLAATAAQNAENIKSQAAQSGFGAGTPSSLVNTELAQNQRDLADQVGRAFTTETGNAYNANLQNFWNAANAATGAANTAQSGALGGTGSAADVYSRLYGQSLGQATNSSQSPLNTIIGTAGTVGAAAACVADHTLIKAEGTDIFSEDIREGDIIIGCDGGREKVIRPPEYERKPGIRLLTASGHKMLCSYDHTLLRPDRGYVKAYEAMNQEILTVSGPSKVIGVHDAGYTRVVRLQLDRSHTFWSDGIASEE